MWSALSPTLNAWPKWPRSAVCIPKSTYGSGRSLWIVYLKQLFSKMTAKNVHCLKTNESTSSQSQLFVSSLTSPKHCDGRFWSCSTEYTLTPVSLLVSLRIWRSPSVNFPAHKSGIFLTSLAMTSVRNTQGFRTEYWTRPRFSSRLLKRKLLSIVAWTLSWFKRALNAFCGR